MRPHDAGVVADRDHCVSCRTPLPRSFAATASIEPSDGEQVANMKSRRRRRRPASAVLPCPLVATAGAAPPVGISSVESGSCARSGHRAQRRTGDALRRGCVNEWDVWKDRARARAPLRPLRSEWRRLALAVLRILPLRSATTCLRIRPTRLFPLRGEELRRLQTNGRERWRWAGRRRSAATPCWKRGRRTLR